jgi:regulatory protein
MIITAIEAQRHGLARVNLYLDGAFRTTLAREVLARSGLVEGDTVSAAALEEMEREDLRWRTRAAALSLLAHQGRSARELARRLAAKGYPPDMADACVAELAEQGLIDDEQYARAVLQSRVRRSPRAKRTLTRELRARGVDPETSETAVEELMRSEGVSDLDLARQAMEKWKPRPGEDPARARRRLAGFLDRRGFTAETIRQILSEARF